MRKHLRLTALLFAASFGLLACSGEGTESGSYVKIEEESLVCSYAGGNVAVSVSSNTDWAVSLSDESGAKILWAGASKILGHGDALLEIKVQPNPMRSDRKAVVKISTTDGSVASVGLTQTGDPSSEVSAEEVKLRIGSYNLRITTGDKSDPDNNWTKRRPRLMQSIKDNAFDIFGVQECDTQLQKDLVSDLSAIYTFWFFSPYSQDGVGNKAQGIGFRTNDFIISDKHFFWNCDTPDVMTTNDICTDASYKRGGCCAVLTHKTTGVKLFFMVTHAALNDDAVVKYAHVFKDMERRWNTNDYPCVFVGDMNAQPENASSAVYREHWKDVYMNLTSDKITGPYGTFNGFELSKDMSKAKRIDFIYYRGGATPLNYTCNTKKYEGFYASDHLPIYSDMIITAK